MTVRNANMANYSPAKFSRLVQLAHMWSVPVQMEECSTVITSSFLPCTLIYVAASSSGQNTATNTVAVVQNLQVKHTTGNVPGHHATVCQ